MSKRLFQLKGIYHDAGKIHLDNRTILEWGQISEETAPNIPYGTRVEINIQIEDRDYLNGMEGIVWATYDKRQAKIIRNALLSQKIACQLKSEVLQNRKFHLLHIPDSSDVQLAIDFIWRERSGLQLKPDWEYPAGAENESFNKWINGL